MKCDMKLSIVLKLIFFHLFLLNYQTKCSQLIEKCDLSQNRHARSALERAKTQTCKQEIERVACLLLQTSQKYNKNYLYSFSLNRTCSYANNQAINSNRSMFFRGYAEKAALLNYMSDEAKNANENKSLFSHEYAHLTQLQKCIDTCLTRHNFKYIAFNANLKPRCFCIRYLNDKIRKAFHETTKLPQNEQDNERVYSIYHTGLLEISKFNATYRNESSETRRKFAILCKENNKNKLPKIVFLLTLNGRSIRQIKRLLKSIYNDYHYYYFHIDKRMVFLRREISELIHSSRKPNLHLADWSMPTVWGGSTLLTMHLRAMQDLAEMRTNERQWSWDFVLNLSETDFPIKSIEELTLFLSENRDKNFLKFYKNNYDMFLKNQGLEYAFLQCENRMWRLGSKNLSLGLQFSGGSDWFCLNKRFVNYLVYSNDELLLNLKFFYNYTLLPSESFFHTALLNSHFCHSNNVVNTHLRFVNWKRHRGCNCQYKNVVDWCGCSPNYFTNEDIETLKNGLQNSAVFFARKFDPLFNQHLINMIDQHMHGLYTTNFKSLNSYWHNFYHEIERGKIEDEKYELLFLFLFKFSIEKFSNLIQEALPINSYRRGKLVEHLASFGNLLEQQHFTRHVRKIEGFFEAQKFKGFVLSIANLDHHGFSFEIEVFVRQRPAKSLIKVFEIDNNNISISKLSDLIVNSLTRLQISTDFDQKERKFFNYAQVMNQQSNPTLLMEFEPLENAIEFFIQWIDPNSIIKFYFSFYSYYSDLVAKIKQVNLKARNSTQIVLNTLFANDQSVESQNKREEKHFAPIAGEWQINICVGESREKLLTIHFLILPTPSLFGDVAYDLENALESIKQSIEKFWHFDSICLIRKTYEHLATNQSSRQKFSMLDEFFLECDRNAHWSTFYPDPKSDLSESFHVEKVNRIRV